MAVSAGPPHSKDRASVCTYTYYRVAEFLVFDTSINQEHLIPQQPRILTLTFDCPTHPKLIKLADWHHELLDLYVYIPTPLRCNRCQRIGHAKNWCRRKDENCDRCTQVGHE